MSFPLHTIIIGLALILIIYDTKFVKRPLKTIRTQTFTYEYPAPRPNYRGYFLLGLGGLALLNTLRPDLIFATMQLFSAFLKNFFGKGISGEAIVLLVFLLFLALKMRSRHADD